MREFLRRLFGRETLPRFPCVYLEAPGGAQGTVDSTWEEATGDQIRAAVEHALNAIDGGGFAMVVIRRDAEWRMIITDDGQHRYIACLMEEWCDVTYWWRGRGTAEGGVLELYPSRADVGGGVAQREFRVMD
jgi:hypothetical protein